MKKAELILTLSIAFVLASCGRNYRIDKKYLEYIPYEENEILVFKSDLNRFDTIFLTGLKRYNGCYDPLSISSDDCEGYSMTCKKSDPNYDRYLEGKELVSVGASPDGKTYISFDITLRSAWFYSMEHFSLRTFDSIPNTEMTIENKTYRDVKTFRPDEYGKQYSSRDHFVERFYWSKNEGFLGLDTRTEKWRLIKKYVP
jgi:hypothetical protein